jgi:hypothetical protein
MRTLLAAAILTLGPMATDAAVISRIDFSGPGIVTFKTGALHPDIEPGVQVTITGEFVFDSPSIVAGSTGAFALPPSSDLAVNWAVSTGDCGFCGDTNFGYYDDPLILTFVDGQLVSFHTFYSASRGFENGELSETTFRLNTIVPDGGDDDFFDYGGDWTLANVRITAIPEPATWALVILGFGLVGGRLRTRQRARAWAPAT